MSWHIILGSGSPRRREILSAHGFSYEVLSPEVSEEHGALPPEEIVRELSRRKAEAVVARLRMERDIRAERYLVIAADTLVAYGGEVLGKPVDREDAARMLRLLQGQTHEVYTGVTLADTETWRDTFCERASVHIQPLTEEQIAEYLRSGEADDKAGAYAIQGIFAKYISGYEGDFETIKGLPGAAVEEHIRRHTC